MPTNAGRINRRTILKLPLLGAAAAAGLPAITGRAAETTGFVRAPITALWNVRRT